MSKQKDLEKQAYELGKKAKAKGKAKKPVNDPELMKLTRSARVGFIEPILKAWHAGFNESVEITKSPKQFHPPAPAVVSGDQPVTKRNLPPKYAMLLKDINIDNEEVLRLLLVYANGHVLIVPPPSEEGADDGDTLFAHALDYFNTESAEIRDEALKVIAAALDKYRSIDTIATEDVPEDDVEFAEIAEKKSVKENVSSRDKYQSMLDALNVLSIDPNDDTVKSGMNKIEAVRVILDLGMPEEKLFYSLAAAGHDDEVINDLIAAAKLEV